MFNQAISWDKIYRRPKENIHVSKDPSINFYQPGNSEKKDKQHLTNQLMY